MQDRIEYAPLSDFLLDTQNPRLTRSRAESAPSQDDLYDSMRDWSLEELATSFLESGFWPHEAVLCLSDESSEGDRLIVIEGNRRIAALQRLQKTYQGEERSKRWRDLISGFDAPSDLFQAVPYMRVASRGDVDAFLGFRHVTGIKEWEPPQKARFIAKLIDERALSYRDVMRKIGSQTPVVARNYIAYCILEQMEETEGLYVAGVLDRFSLLFLALRSRRVQQFLGVERKFEAAPTHVKPPVDAEHIDQLREFSKWLFGDADTTPIVKDSRQIDKFAVVLASPQGLDYLRQVPDPDLEHAYIVSGGERQEVYDLVARAAYSLQQALSSLHLYKEDADLRKISQRLVANADQVRTTLGL